jgi:protein-L-isoaspartate(D-aspartate) O-methyltransferase
VLDIGAGSGCAAAVLAEIAAHVGTVERLPQLADNARDRLNSLGYDIVGVHTADGTLGLPSHAPFDAIPPAASGPCVPPAWSAQLEIGGRHAAPQHPFDRRPRIVVRAMLYCC